jgi:hypothetical protein
MIASETSLIQVFAGSILGLFGGVGATVVWEGLIKPHLDRRNLSRSLATEILANRTRLVRALATRNSDPRKLPFSLHLSTIVFESVAERIAELPEEILPDLIRLFHQFVYVNAIRAHLKENLDQRPGADNATEEVLRKRFSDGLEGLDTNLQIAIEWADELLPKLVRYSRFTSAPWLQLLADEQTTKNSALKDPVPD